MRRNLLLLSVLILHVLGVCAQVSVDLLMDTLDIPAVNIPKAISRTGRNVSVITAKQISQLPVTTIDELLRYIPGIEVQSRNAFGAQSDISMRGSTYQQTIVVIDGMRMNTPLTAHFNGNIPIAPSEIARIEILRGPAAAVYGPDAVGGVINIVTKTFLVSNKNEDDDAVADISLNYGENNLWNGNAGVQIKTNGVKIGLGGLLNKSTGQLVPEQYTIDGSDTVGAYNNYFDIRTATFSVALPVGEKWQLGFRTGLDVRDFSARYFYTNSVFDHSEEVTSNLWLQAQARRINENSSTDINLTYRYATDTFAFSPAVPSLTNMHATEMFFAQVNHLQQVNEKIDAKLGAQLDYRTITSNDRGDHNDVHFGVYAMSILRPVNGLQIAASLRMDYEKTYNVQVLPQLSASYVLNDKMTLRATAGRSIRAADYTERYNNYNKTLVGANRRVGNPDLKTEISWSEELGFDVFPIPQWRLSATGFVRQGTDLIDYVSTPGSEINNVPTDLILSDSTTYDYAKNISSATLAGFEVESWYSRDITDGVSVDWGVGYTFLRSSNADGVISTYISNHARDLLTTNLIVKIGRVELAINGLYKTRMARAASGVPASSVVAATLEDNYTVWNGRVQVSIKDGLSANFYVHNMFNEQYADYLGAKMPNRWLMAGVKWQLK